MLLNTGSDISIIGESTGNEIGKTLFKTISVYVCESTNCRENGVKPLKIICAILCFCKMWHKVRNGEWKGLLIFNDPFAQILILSLKKMPHLHMSLIIQCVCPS